MGLEHESTRGWDGVGIMIVGTGWVGKKFFLIQRGWDGVGYKLCRNGWGWGSLGNHLQASTLKTNLWGLLIWDFCRPNALPVPHLNAKALRGFFLPFLLQLESVRRWRWMNDFHTYLLCTVVWATSFVCFVFLYVFNPPFLLSTLASVASYCF